MVLALSLNQVLHCNCGPGSKIAIAKSLQSLGIILLQVEHEFNIYFTNGECMLYEIITSLNLLKSGIATGVQSALIEPLSFGNSYKVLDIVKLIV